MNGDYKSKDPPSAESKSAKKKKRKDKTQKEVKESLDLLKTSDSPDGPEETTETKQAREDTFAAGVPKMKVQLKKPLPTEKKKKPNKEIDAVARTGKWVTAFRRVRGSSTRGVRIWAKSESLLF